VKDATQMAHDTWRRMTKHEQDKLVMINRSSSSGLSGVDVTPLGRNFSGTRKRQNVKEKMKKGGRLP
jgi:hypothetical protein